MNPDCSGSGAVNTDRVYRALGVGAAIAVGLACGVPSGCGKKPGVAGNEAKQTAVTPSELTASPVARASENGLEVTWWVVTSDQTTIAAAMAPYLNRPVPIDDQVRALWEANGLRVVAVPMERLEELRQSMPIVGAVQRQWLGQTPTWTDTVSGPVWAGNRALALDTGRLSLGPGRLRLLTRCWTVPVPVKAQEADPSPAAALHIELVPQHLEADRRTGGATGSGAGLVPTKPVSDMSDPLDEGLVFRRLLVEMTVSQGDAYIIIPQEYGADWTPPSERPEKEPAKSGRVVPEGGTKAGPVETSTDTQADPKRQPPAPDAGPAPKPVPTVPRLGQVSRESPGEATAKPEPSVDDAGTGAIGPPEIQALSLGEVLLTSSGARDPKTAVPDPGSKGVWRADRPARAILVFIPRVPDRYRLIGR